MFKNVMSALLKARESTPYVIKSIYDSQKDVLEWQVWNKEDLIFVCLSHEKTEAVCDTLNDVYVTEKVIEAMFEPDIEMIRCANKIMSFSNDTKLIYQSMIRTALSGKNVIAIKSTPNN